VVDCVFEFLDPAGVLGLKHGQNGHDDGGNCGAQVFHTAHLHRVEPEVHKYFQLFLSIYTGVPPGFDRV
jgi:hypothetical protein